MLNSIGRSLGQQVRVTRSESPNFVAVSYYAPIPTPIQAILELPADVVRSGQNGAGSGLVRPKQWAEESKPKLSMTRRSGVSQLF